MWSTGPQAHRPTGQQANRPTGPQAHRPTGPQAHRPTVVQAGLPQLRFGTGRRACTHTQAYSKCQAFLPAWQRSLLHLL